MLRGGAGGGATPISGPAPSSPSIGGGGSVGMSSSSVLTMSGSEVIGQLGTTGGGTALPKLELHGDSTKWLTLAMNGQMFIMT